MSWTNADKPVCKDAAEPEVLTVIEPRARDIGAFEVRRLLPAARQRMVGPFIFFDAMGPAVLPAGQGMSVPPHPHIGLATVTYLFAGEVAHRDSLGSFQIIEPGAINWMVAGKGIAHSERSPEGTTERERTLHGIQLWVALPAEHEEAEPDFQHHAASSIPESTVAGARVRVLIGEAYGLRSPVETFSPMVYAEAQLEAGAALEMPVAYPERAIYIVSGELELDGQVHGAGRMLVVRSGPLTVHARSPLHLMILGGEPVGERHIWWNFVSSSKERIEIAKAEWREERFPAVPGDDERTALPES